MIDVTFPLWIYPILVWTVVWKAVGAWKAARKGDFVWFVAFFIFNTVGILPMVYIFFFQKLDFSKKRGKKVSRKLGKRIKKFPSLS